MLNGVAVPLTQAEIDEFNAEAARIAALKALPVEDWEGFRAALYTSEAWAVINTAPMVAWLDRMMWMVGDNPDFYIEVGTAWHAITQSITVTDAMVTELNSLCTAHNMAFHVDPVTKQFALGPAS